MSDGGRAAQEGSGANRRSRAAASLALALLAGCTGSAPAPAGNPSALSLSALASLASPAGPGSAEPNLALAPDGELLLSWIEPGTKEKHALRFASRRPGGAWSEPRTIAEGSDWFVNWADFPAMAALPDGTLFAHLLAKKAGGAFAYDIKVLRSRDRGTTWGAPITPHGDGVATEHGFVSFFPLAKDRMGLVWLDGRHLKPGGHSEEGDMALLSASLSAEGPALEETLVDRLVCSCCQTSAAAIDGGVLVAYRDRTEKEIRDVAVARWTDGRWSEPRVVGKDGWEINACPVNGPAVAAEGRRVVLAWFGAPQDEAKVSLVFSEDGGVGWGRPVRVDDGKPLGRVDAVLLPGGDALVSWMEQTSKGTEIRVRRVASDGRLGPPLLVADSSAARTSGFPRMERAGRDVVFAWTAPGDAPQVRTAVLTLER